MKRLEREGKTDIIEKIKKAQETVEQGEHVYCFLCQSKFHNYTDCDKYAEYARVIGNRLPPVLLAMVSKDKIQNLQTQDEQESTHEIEESETEETANTKAPEVEQASQNLSKPMRLFSNQLEASKEPTCIAMVAPVSALQDLTYKISIVPGGISRGKTFGQIQTIFNKLLVADEQQYGAMQLKNIQEHSVVLAVPNGWELRK